MGLLEVPIIVAAIVLIPECISFLASLLHHRCIGRPPPPELQGLYDEKEYQESTEYTRAKSGFKLAKSVFDLVVLFAFWFSHGFALLNELCERMVQTDILTGILYIVLISVAGFIMELPWSIYATFVQEAKFGFNRTTPITFVKDKVKSCALAAVLGLPLLGLILLFFIKTGSWGWLYVFLTITVFQVVLMFLMPVLILPLFFEMIPLPDGTALISSKIDEGKGHSFLSSRVFYSHDEVDGRPSWITKDRRFTGGKGATVVIRWSASKSLWEMIEPGTGGALFATATSSSSPDSAPVVSGSTGFGWVTEPAEPQNAGDGEQHLLQSSFQTSCADVGALRQRLLNLAEQCGYHGASIFVIDGSSRSEHSNAFCIGFGRFRRICLFDTLLPLLSEDEIVAVLAHEIGHDKLFHVHANLISGIIYQFIVWFCLGQFITSPLISEAFFVKTPRVWVGLVLFMLVWSVVDFVVQIPLTIFSRSCEYAADRYSVKANRAHGLLLGSGLKQLMRKSKANLTPHPLYVFLTYSHPPLDDRLKAIDKLLVDG